LSFSTKETLFCHFLIFLFFKKNCIDKMTKVKSNKSSIGFQEHTGPKIAGVILIIIGFLILGSIIVWNFGLSDFGSIFGQSGNLGAVIGEILLVSIIVAGAGLLFYWMGVDKSAEKVANASVSIPDLNQRAKVVELVAGRGKSYFINERQSIPAAAPVDENSDISSDEE
jgi:hypothetical protein